jgi:hypothetical protein
MVESNRPHIIQCVCVCVRVCICVRVYIYIYIYIYVYIHSGIHKSVKHFKNSQQIDYATDLDNLKPIEKETIQVFLYDFTNGQCVNLW